MKEEAMSEIKLEDIDMSAADKPNLPPAERERKPFHETLVSAIGVLEPGTITLVQILIETTIIPAGHDAIISAIDKRKEEVESLGSMSSLYLFDSQLDLMRDEVSEQKAEAEVRHAKKQKQQATDGAETALLKAKIQRLATIIHRMHECAQSPHGIVSQIAYSSVLKTKANTVIESKTVEEVCNLAI